MTGTTTQPRTLREAFGRQWQAWPAGVRVVWFVVRPLCTVVALASLPASDAPVLAVVAAAVLLVVARPVARQWIAPVVAVAVWFVSPVAAVAVLLRVVVTVVVLLVAGRSWRRGLVLVRRGRRAFLHLPPPRVVERRLRRSLLSPGDSLDFSDPIIELWAVTWALADARSLGRCTVRLARGLLWWDWGVPTGPNFEARLLRLGLTESAVLWSSRVGAVVVAGGGALLTGLTTSGRGLPEVVSALLAALPAWSLTRRSVRTRPPITGTVLLFAAGPVVFGVSALPLLGWGIVVGLLARAVFPAATARMIGSDDVAPRLPLAAGIGARRTWNAARRTHEDGRAAEALRLWGELAGDGSRSPAVRAAAHAATAHVHLDRGAVQEAVRCAEDALAFTDVERVRPLVDGIAGRVFLAAGDDERAARLLDHAVTSRRQRRDPQVLAALAQVRASATDPDEALLALGRATGGLLRSGNVYMLVEAEVAVVARYADRLPLADLESRLSQVLSFEDDAFPGMGPVRRERVREALARARLLLGRLHADHGRNGTASAHLRKALEDFGGPALAVDRAVTSILLGVVRNRSNPRHGLPELTAGVHALEEARGQLATGRYRTRLVHRHTETYRLALDALTRLLPVEPAAGMVAFELVESLRRNALARTLRDRISDFGPEVEGFRSRIEEVEAVGGPESEQELVRLHDGLARTLSAEFASVYLPEPVRVQPLREVLGNAHCLAYHFTEIGSRGAHGHVVHLPPQGDAVVRPVTVRDPDLLAVLRADEPAARHAVLSRRQSHDVEARRWAALGAELLPDGLRRALASADEAPTLVVVPSAELSAFPWAALPVDGQQLLVEAAVVQIVPALAVLTPDPAPADDGPVLAYVDPSVGTAEEARVVAELGHHPVASRDAMLGALRSGRFAGAYVAAHGDGRGLTQRMVFHDGGALSAATALTLPWPPWVVFAACFVGDVRVDTGQDPLGLPVSCLLGGADSVIGGIIAVNSAAASTVCPDIAGGIRRGEHPAVALRHAQLAHLRSFRSRPAPVRWAGFTCVSRTVARG
ncbi:CHAT domain-containing protein [Saccharothrix carnea]|uniref:CHAT domain-containing protein n=1 Tax=Saccharothrix carnea TaxID=1280637 RepID=A0A2P8I113_SACCR|nr:CHAT domain-containing protein [Saccharothrix carnea]PSL52113.1 CHAT domain-containing protein [Saccharothrix carnea]